MFVYPRPSTGRLKHPGQEQAKAERSQQADEDTDGARDAGDERVRRADDTGEALQSGIRSEDADAGAQTDP